MIAICSSLLSLVYPSSTQTGLEIFSCLSFFDANGTKKYFFDVYLYFLRTNIWYVFVRWYNSTENFHVQFSHDFEYIFTYRIQVYNYTVVDLYRKCLRTENKVFMVLFIRTNFKYRFIRWYYCTENVYIRDFYRSFSTDGS